MMPRRFLCGPSVPSSVKYASDFFCWRRIYCSLGTRKEPLTGLSLTRVCQPPSERSRLEGELAGLLLELRDARDQVESSPAGLLGPSGAAGSLGSSQDRRAPHGGAAGARGRAPARARLVHAIGHRQRARWYDPGMPQPRSERQSFEEELAELPVQGAGYRWELALTPAEDKARWECLESQIQRSQWRLTTIEARLAALGADRAEDP